MRSGECGPVEDPNSLVRKVGRRIAELRRAAGMTQEEMAEKLRVGWRYMSRMERGLNLTLGSLVHIANVLGVEVRDLLEEPSDQAREIKRGRPRKNSSPERRRRVRRTRA